MRAMVKDFGEALMGVEADTLCGAANGERSPERVNKRNGYRERAWGAQRGHDRARNPEAARALLRVRDAAAPGRDLAQARAVTAHTAIPHDGAS